MQLTTRCVLLTILVLMEVSTNLATADELRITPAGLKFSEVGESQQIICSIITQNPNISMLLIQRYLPVGTWSGLPTEIISSNSKSFTISNLTLQDRGKYRCSYNETYRIMQLFVDYPPRISQDVNCSVVDAAMMTCSWSLQDEENDILSNWTVRGTDGFSAKTLCTRQETSETRLTCTWNDIMAYSMYTIYVDGFNRVGITNRTYVVNTTHNVMLSNLSIRTEVGSHNVTLHWTLTDAFFYRCVYELCKINYTVVYKAIGGEEIRMLNIESSNCTVKYTIQNLTPFTTYEITVSGRPQGSVLWSNNTTVKVSTEKAVPAAPPVTDERLYYTNISSRKERTIFLYFKPIPASQIYSDNVGYNFILYQVSVSKEILKWTYNTTYLNGTFEFPVALRNESSYRISVCSFNELGFSTNSTDIVIPATIPVPFLPRNVKVDGNCKNCSSGIYQLTWNMDKNQITKVQTFIVMWCKGENVPTCRGDLHWSVHSSNESFALVNVGDQGNSHWLFGVSASNKSGYSGGIQFAIKSTHNKGIPSIVDGYKMLVILVSTAGGAIVLLIIIVVIFYLRSRYNDIQLDIRLPADLTNKQTGFIASRKEAFSHDNDKHGYLDKNSFGSSDSGVPSDCSVSDVKPETEEDAPADYSLKGNRSTQNEGDFLSPYSLNDNRNTESDQGKSSDYSIRDKLSVENNTNMLSSDFLNDICRTEGNKGTTSRSTHNFSPGKQEHFHEFPIEGKKHQYESVVDGTTLFQTTCNHSNKRYVLHNDNKYVSNYVTADASYSDSIQFSNSTGNHLTESENMSALESRTASGDWNNCSSSFSLNYLGYNNICFVDDQSTLTDVDYCDS